MGVKLREKKLKDGKISLYLDISHNGKRNYEFLNIKISGNKRLTKADREMKDLAEKIRAEREYDLIVRGNGMVNKKKRQADFVPYFSRIVDQKANSMWTGARKHLEVYMNGQPLSFGEIDVDWILGYQDYLLTQVHNNTARHYVKAVCIALNLSVEEKIIRWNPFKDIPKSKRLKLLESKRTFLTLEELQVLAKTPCKIPEQSKQMFLFCCFTGLRWSDAASLSWDQVHTMNYNGQDQYVIDYRQQKTKVEELLPLSAQATKIFLARKKEADALDKKSDKVFPIARNPKAVKDRNAIINKHVKKWCKAAGITKKIHFHSSRHTFATLTLTYGADIYTVSKLLGHKDIATTTIYAKIIDQMKNKAVDNLPTIDFGEEE